jgi:glycosyltransferase involved in cell wall biosynthesis
MKVLHLNTHSSGGSYEFAVMLKTALTKQGVKSHILSKSLDCTSGVTKLGDRALRRAYVNLSRTAWHTTRRLLPPPSITDIQGVDIVHFHTVADWFDVPNWLLGLPEHIGVVVSLHDLWHISGGCFIYQGCDRLAQGCQTCPILHWPANQILARDELNRKLQAYQSRRATIVANSQWLASMASQSPIVQACGGVKFIRPAIATGIFKPQDKIACRQQWGLPPEAFIIVTGCTSLTDTNKNTPWLLEQLAELTAINSVVVVAFGDGELPVPEGLDVRFVGSIRDRWRLAQLMVAGDVFVSASKMETYGLTLVEAMACGTTVVAFRVGGIPEAVPEEYGALLIPPGDSQAMLSAIAKIRESRLKKQTEINQSAINSLRQQNSPEVFAKAYMDIYQHCLTELALHRY